MNIACIVEGHGEADAVPLLIRRIAAELGAYPSATVVLRAPKSKLMRTGELEKSVGFSVQKAGLESAVFLVVDADDDSYEDLVASIVNRISRSHPHIAFAAAVPVKEFESRFIAGIEGIYGCRGFPTGIDCPADPEAIQGAKEWLSERMPPQQVYSPTAYQAAFTAKFDMHKPAGGLHPSIAATARSSA